MEDFIVKDMSICGGARHAMAGIRLDKPSAGVNTRINQPAREEYEDP